MKTILKNCIVVLPEGLLSDGAVVIDQRGKIEYVGSESNLPAIEGTYQDLGGKYLAPGLIDIHVHGGNGITFGENDLAATTAFYSNWAASNGVTGYLMSVAEETSQALLEMITDYVKVFRNPPDGAEPLGLHLEGPYLSVEKKGAFNPAWLRYPDVKEAKAYLQAGQGWIHQITIAPELPNASQVARIFREADVVVALGHTNINYEEASQALKGDFNHVTHAFNAQRGFDHRAPGVFGAVLTSETVTAELIADCVHVHPGAMKLLLRCLSSDRVVAITDAMSGAGLAEGNYHLVGHSVTVKDGRATLENGTLAGSVATLNQCVANLIKYVDLPLHEAIRMASLNPARVIGAADRLGSITEGKDANLIVIDEAINVFQTMVKGQIVYNQFDQE
ncbi:MAG: N-acetylglucosamine-6-phosphate deacetylase [Anaerolineaceae bacterium]